MSDDRDDGVPIETTTWPGDGEWTGPVEIIYSPGFSGDVIFTLPRAAYHSDSLDGLSIDVSIPMGALWHLMSLVDEMLTRDVLVSRAQVIAAIQDLPARRRD
jgi:hypothetical protein